MDGNDANDKYDDDEDDGVFNDADDDSELFDTANIQQITQAELAAYVELARDLRETLIEFGERRRSLVRRLERGDGVECGPITVSLSPLTDELHTWPLVDRALAAVQSAYLKGKELDSEYQGLKVKPPGRKRGKNQKAASATDGAASAPKVGKFTPVEAI